MAFYIVNKLFTPLGVSNYVLNTDCNRLIYFDDILHFTLVYMLRFKNLCLSNGTWNGRRIISEK